MPIYDYECINCSARFELRRSFDDESETHCPKCNEEARRLFTPVPVIFCASGFYSTDSRNNTSHPQEPEPASSS